MLTSTGLPASAASAASRTYTLAASPLLPQFLGLTGTLMLFSFAALMSYAVLARQAHRWVPGRSSPGRGLQRVVGGAFILLGLALLLSL